ncbi:conserved hypothetical protein [Ricinus communis]|uniref:Uncharacterized protein n=1 Tax=Ricinus communis TaxID=3988 RepID=B9T2L5_RICCO|nr:conserved hypothetical protein [Ricinus communis]
MDSSTILIASFMIFSMGKTRALLDHEVKINFRWGPSPGYLCLSDRSRSKCGSVMVVTPPVDRSRPGPTGGHLPQCKLHCSPPPEKQKI